MANELKLGHSVPPKLFSSATVLFSDIVGFTKLCSNSTPLEVVNLLNGIYAGFDEKICIYNSYKVETVRSVFYLIHFLFIYLNIFRLVMRTWLCLEYLKKVTQIILKI